jgi:hypothetical protein
MEINELKDRHARFLIVKFPVVGKQEINGKELTNIRKGIYDKYRMKFTSQQLNNLSRDDFNTFLTPIENMSWPLQRGCKKVTTKMPILKEVLIYLQNKDIDIEDRLNNVLVGGQYHIEGFGKNLATGLLHVFDWGKYGVWNNCSEGALRKIGWSPVISFSNLGKSYKRVNAELERLSRDLEIDLAELDCFLWWLDDRKEI